MAGKKQKMHDIFDGHERGQCGWSRVDEGEGKIRWDLEVRQWS